MAKETKVITETPEVSAETKALLEKIAKLEAENLALSEKKENDTACVQEPEKELSRAERRERDNEMMEERVQVQLFKDDKEYKDDLPVSVNGETILIQRGFPVMIKRKHAKVIEQQARQQLVAIKMSESLSGYRKMD